MVNQSRSVAVSQSIVNVTYKQASFKQVTALVTQSAYCLMPIKLTCHDSQVKVFMHAWLLVSNASSKTLKFLTLNQFSYLIDRIINIRFLKFWRSFFLCIEKNHIVCRNSFECKQKQAIHLVITHSLVPHIFSLFCSVLL